MVTKNFPKRAEVWSIHTPNKPYDPHQPRTAIIVSTNGRNEKANHVTAVPTFHNARALRTHVFLSKGSGGLDKDTFACCEQITTIDKSLLHKGPFGSLTEDQMNQIVKAIRLSIGEVVVDAID